MHSATEQNKMIEMDFPEVFIGLAVCGDVGLDRSPNRRPAPSHLEQGRESLRPAGGSPAKYLGRCRASRAARPYFSEEHFVPLAHLALAPCPPPPPPPPTTRCQIALLGCVLSVRSRCGSLVRRAGGIFFLFRLRH